MLRPGPSASREAAAWAAQFTVTGTVSLDFGGYVLEAGLNASGTGTVDLTAGTATVAGSATLPNLQQTGGTLTGPGTLTVTGLTTWYGGTMAGSGTTSAIGGMKIGDPGAGTYGEYLDQRTLDNAGPATLDWAYNAASGYRGLYLSSGTTLDNQPGASFSFISDASIIDNGGTPDGGTLINEGTLSKTGGTGISDIGGGITLTSTGTIQSLSGTLRLFRGGTLAGTVEAEAGGSLTMTNPPANLSGGTLTGATWIVGAGSDMSLDANITTDAATIVLDGAGADFSSLAPLAQIARGGILQVVDGGSFTTAGDLDNAGTIGLAAGTLNVAGNYTQEVRGNYDVGVGGLGPGTQFGQLNVTELATLNGVLSASLIDGYAPPPGGSYPVLTFGSVSGNFSAEFGLEFGNGAGFTPVFNPSMSPTELDLVVVTELPGTQTTVQSSENPSSYSDAVTFTVDVSPLASTGQVPSGNVTFYNGGAAIDTETLVDGSASFTTSALMAGQNPIVAQYNGDPNFSRSNSTGLLQVVNQVDSTTAVASSLNPSVGGESVTFTATVSAAAPATGTPTGTVTFYNGTTAIDIETLSGGSASYTTSTLAAGDSAITAVYGGDTNFNGSQSPVITQTVIPARLIWTNAAGGDWDTASNWVNAANPSDHHVPTDYDNAQINISGITVTHNQSTLDSVDALTVASGTTLSVSNGSLSIGTDSTISGDLTLSGGSLLLAAGLTVSGSTDWTGGTITGGGTITTQGFLTLGDPGQSDAEVLDGAKFDNEGAATIATLDPGSYGLSLFDGATFDNQLGASFTYLTDAGIDSNGIDSPTFVNEGTFTKAGGTGSSLIYAAFDQTDTGATEVQTGTLQLDGGGTITGTMTADAKGELDFDSGTFNLDAASTITGAGTISVTGGASVKDAGDYTVTGNTDLNSFSLDFDGGQSVNMGTLTMSGGLLTGFTALTVTSSMDWTGGTITGDGTIITQGSLTLGDPGESDIELLDGVTLDNQGAATIATLDSQYFGLYLFDGATFDNQPGASFTYLTDGAHRQQRQRLANLRERGDVHQVRGNGNVVHRRRLQQHRHGPGPERHARYRRALHQLFRYNIDRRVVRRLGNASVHRRGDRHRCREHHAQGFLGPDHRPEW